MAEPANGDAHAVYKELSGEINSLSRDVVAAISIFRAAHSEVKGDLERHERRLDELTEKLLGLQVQLAAVTTTLEAEERRRNGELTVKAENTKGRWAFWVAVGGGAIGTVTAIVNALAAWLS